MIKDQFLSESHEDGLGDSEIFLSAQVMKSDGKAYFKTGGIRMVEYSMDDALAFASHGDSLLDVLHECENLDSMSSLLHSAVITMKLHST